jgi:ribosomal-protein-alanine N-acetyltransferase
MAKPIKLSTRRLLLRPFELSDAPDVYEYAQDPEWAKFLPLPSPYTLGDAEEFVARSFLTDWHVSPIFAITLSGKVIGSFDVRVDPPNSAAEVGYAIGKPHWGWGFMAEAGDAAIAWAFKEFDLTRICARADLQNHQSLRVMEKLGMQREGIARSSGPSAHDPNIREDTVTYSILRDEWERSANSAK